MWGPLLGPLAWEPEAPKTAPLPLVRAPDEVVSLGVLGLGLGCPSADDLGGRFTQEAAPDRLNEEVEEVEVVEVRSVAAAGQMPPWPWPWPVSLMMRMPLTVSRVVKASWASS